MGLESKRPEFKSDSLCITLGGHFIMLITIDLAGAGEGSQMLNAESTA